ncbi:MAG: hypothetical protein PHE84_00805 [bacterium]|nr:hypothetical protein [bacterium]
MDYRENVYVDKDHPVFKTPRFLDHQGQPTQKLLDLADPHKKDGLVWSVFMTFNKLDYDFWLPRLGELVYGRPIENVSYIAPHFWRPVAPPLSRYLWIYDNLKHPRIAASRGGKKEPKRLAEVAEHTDYWKDLAREGILNPGMDGCLEEPAELDLILDSPSFVIAVIARNSEDIFGEETWDRERDEIGKVIDLGLKFTEGKKAFYLMLITDKDKHEPAKLYDELIPRYRSDPDFLKNRLPHRSEAELDRLRGHLDRTSWSDIINMLRDSRVELPAGKRKIIKGLFEYLEKRNLA